MIYISDALNPVIPKGCKMQQVAIQQPPEFPGDLRYIIDENLWDKLDSNSKAALIIHEIFYNEGIFLGHQNSKAVRYMTGIVTSTRMRKISQSEFAKLIFVSNFVAADMFGTMLTKTYDYIDAFTLETDKSTYFASYLPNDVKIGYLHFGRYVYINLSKKHARPTSALTVTSFKKRNIEGRSEAGGNLALTFDEHGKVVEIGVQSKPANIRLLNWEIKAEPGVRIQLVNEMPRKVSGTIQVRNEMRNYDSGKVEMYSTTDDAPNIDSVGFILKRLITTPTIFKTPQGDRLFHSDSGLRYPVTFTSEGTVTIGLLAKGEKIETEKGHFITNGLCEVTYLQNGLASVSENCFLIEVK